MNNFPVIKTVKNSFAFVFEHPRQAAKVMWPYVLILIALITIMPYFPEAEEAFDITIWPLVILASVMVSLPWQRIYLLGIVPDNQPRQPISRHEWLYRTIYAFFLICLVITCLYLFMFPFILPVYILHNTSYIFYIPLWLIITISPPFIFMLLCAPFLPYLSALAIDNPITLKDSFRLSKGGTIRLSFTVTLILALFNALITALIFTAGLWNLDGDYEATRVQLADWLKTSDMPAEAQDGMIETFAFSSTESWIDFLLLWPTPIILGLFFSLVITGHIAQFYKWALENRR